MISKQKTFISILVCILFFIIYFFTAATTLKEQIHLQPVWTIDIIKNRQNHTEHFPVYGFTHHFKLGQNLGYFDTDGQIGLFKTFPFKAAVSDNFWTLYSQDHSITSVFTPQKTEIATIKATGFPHFDKNRIYIFHPGGNSFSSYTNEGTLLWTHEEASIITAFDSSPGGTVAGFSNGNIFYTDSTSFKTTVFSPGGSNYEIIFGLAISENGKYIAALCGLEKQRIVIAQIENQQVKIFYHEFLESETREQSLVYFNSANDKVFVNTNKGIVSVNINTLNSTHFDIEGTTVNIIECTVKNKQMYAVLSKKEKSYWVSLINNNAVKMGSFNFVAKNAFITSEGNSLFVGKDTSISRIDVIKE
ncbi:MAG TPA: hypothetical protein VFC68_02715 [Treponemataceae bacterium]|nr:hypothetical protein [Treponemataceae bacterium]